MPELRIIDQELWEAVKARQDSVEGSKFGEANKGHIARRIPRYLLSGLMTCGACGGGMIHLNSVRVGCANARNKGTSGNLTTLRRDVREATVLDGLQNELMAPELVALFCEEYTKHKNKLAAAQRGALAADKAALAKTEREIERLVQAILDGVPGSQVKDKMAQLEARKVELQGKLARAEDDAPVLLHPHMADYYRRQIEDLRNSLADTQNRRRSVAAFRALVERVELVPVEHEGRKTLAVNLHGQLTAILSMAAGGGAKTKKPSSKDGLSESVAMVAGAGFEPATFRL